MSTFLRYLGWVLAIWLGLIVFCNGAMWFLTKGVFDFRAMVQMLPFLALMSFLPACMIGIQVARDSEPYDRS